MDRQTDGWMDGQTDGWVGWVGWVWGESMRLLVVSGCLDFELRWASVCTLAGLSKAPSGTKRHPTHPTCHATPYCTPATTPHTAPLHPCHHTAHSTVLRPVNPLCASPSLCALRHEPQPHSTPIPPCTATSLHTHPTPHMVTSLRAPAHDASHRAM